VKGLKIASLVFLFVSAIICAVELWKEEQILIFFTK